MARIGHQEHGFDLGLEALAEAPVFERVSTEVVGEDVLTIFKIPK